MREKASYRNAGVLIEALEPRLYLNGDIPNLEFLHVYDNIYNTSVNDEITSLGEEDQFTMDLLAGQLLTLVAAPSTSLDLNLTLRDSNSNIIESSNAEGLGGLEILYGYRVQTSGRYTISLSSLAGTGSYQVMGSLDCTDEIYPPSPYYGLAEYFDSTLETEGGQIGGNNTLAQAENIDNVFSSAGGIGEYASILGEIGVGNSVGYVQENFESGEVGENWEFYAYSPGWIGVSDAYTAGEGNYALIAKNTNYNMRRSTGTAIWTVNLEGLHEATLSFLHGESGDDEFASYVENYEGGHGFDGVSISDDGINWHVIWDAVDQSTEIWQTTFWQRYSFDLGAEARKAGMELGDDFKIKFDTYGAPPPDDYRGWDNISISIPQEKDVYSVSLEEGETLSLAVASGNELTSKIELLDASGAVLARGVYDDGDFLETISNFKASSSGTYYIRVTGVEGAKYALNISKNAELSNNPQKEISDDGEVRGQVKPFAYHKLYAAKGDSLKLSIMNHNDDELYRVSIRLYSPDGVLVAETSETMRGSTQEPLTFTATDTGNYTVELVETVASKYNSLYALRVEGNTPRPQEISTTGEVLGVIDPEINSTNLYTVSVAEGDVLNLSAVMPDGNDFPAGSQPVIQLYSPDSVLVGETSGTTPGSSVQPLTHNAAVSGDYRIEVTSGESFTGAYVLMTQGYNAETQNIFKVDSTGTFEGENFETLPRRLVIRFSDQILLTSIDAADVTINGVTCTGFSVVDGRTIAFDVPQTPVAQNVVHIAAGAITDFQGIPVEEFETSFKVGQFEKPLTFVEAKPFGGLIYSATVDGAIRPMGDSNHYSLGTIQEGQTITIAAESDDGLQPVIELYKDGILVGSSQSYLNASKAIIQNFVVSESGEYNFVIKGSTSTQGTFNCDVYLNSMVNPVSDFNVSQENAIDLTDNFTNIGNDSFQRVAVHGSQDGQPQWYKIHLDNGQTISAAVTRASNMSVAMGIYDSAGTKLLGENTSASNSNACIPSFTAPQAGDYFLLVDIQDADEYNLLITRNGLFESLAYQDITGLRNVLGHARQSVDYYKVSVNAGDVISLSTMTPFDSDGATKNTLDPQLFLYDPDENQIINDKNSAADGRNASIYHAAKMTGEYFVAVWHENGTSGTYLLNLEVTDRTVADMWVISVTPEDGYLTQSPLNKIQFEFSHAIDPDSLDVSDILLGDTNISDVSLLDDYTVEFTITDLQDGTHTIELLADAFRNVYGVYNNSFVSTFTFDAPDFAVTTTNLPSQVYSIPDTLTVYFSQNILEASLDPSDFTIGGLPATDAWLLDANSAVFQIPQELGEGLHTIVLEEGAIKDIYGQDNNSYSSSLRLTHGPIVISSSIVEDQVLAAGSHVYTAQFDLPLAELDLSSFMLEGPNGVMYFDEFQYDPGTQTLSLPFEVDIEGEYTLALRSGSNDIKSIYGFILDGEANTASTTNTPSGDGVPGGDFEVHFSGDYVEEPLPMPWNSIDIPGSISAWTSISGLINNPGDADRFTVDLEAGQMISAGLDVSDDLWVTLEVQDSSGNTLDTVSGESVCINGVQIDVTDTYIFVITGTDQTTGDYNLTVWCNALVESEEFSGRENGTLATPQNIDNGFNNLGNGVLQSVVIGKLPDPLGIAIFDEDFGSYMLSSQWETYSSTGHNSVRIADLVTYPYYPLSDNPVMWLAPEIYGVNTLSEAILNIDLTGSNDISLNFEYTIGPYPYPYSYESIENFEGEFDGHYNADGIAISVDGEHWYPVWDAVGSYSPSYLAPVTLNLSEIAEALDITLGADTQIKFQQYGYYPKTYGGIAFDNIAIRTPEIDEDWYSLELNEGEAASFLLAGENSDIELYDASGNLLAAGSKSADETKSVISDFIADASQTCYVRLSGTADYKLEVVRGAGIDSGTSDDSQTVQDIAVTRKVVGSLKQGDIDSFSLDMQAGELLKLTIKDLNDNTPVDITVNIYNPNGELIVSNETTSEMFSSEGVIFGAEADGAYIITMQDTSSPISYLLELEQTDVVLPGDADFDGDVDADDLATWGANYTGADGEGKAWGHGDFDHDGDVDADDLASWGANYTGDLWSKADFNENGVVDGADFNTSLSNWTAGNTAQIEAGQPLLMTSAVESEPVLVTQADIQSALLSEELPQQDEPQIVLYTVPTYEKFISIRPKPLRAHSIAFEIPNLSTALTSSDDDDSDLVGFFDEGLDVDLSLDM